MIFYQTNFKKFCEAVWKADTQKRDANRFGLELTRSARAETEDVSRLSGSTDTKQVGNSALPSQIYIAEAD